ncbi:MAG: DUF1697 domain-containing protein [Flavobacteriaceae bacterium]|nr:DUF1697 domain-containing protein [Flavobacteriaceae bacterium]
MKKYVAFLRGINVGGHRKIKMEDLRKLVEKLGFKNVKTYIQSGNLIFETELNHCEAIAESIKEKIRVDYGFDVPAIVFDAEKFKEYVEFNPFRISEKVDNKGNTEIEKKENLDRKEYFIFLDSLPDFENQRNLPEVNPETTQYFLHERVLYLRLVEPYHQAKFTHKTVEKYLELNATARNINTVEKMVELLGK